MQTESKAAEHGRIATAVKGHPRLAIGLAMTVLAAAIAGFIWFRPDKLFTDSIVNEDAPPGAPADPAQPAQAGPDVLSRGQFRDLEHDTSGTAKALRAQDGTTYVRLENFSTSDGPDVIVILSETPATEDDWGAYDDGEFVALGALKGTKGSQNYKVPADVDLTAYKSVVIWCRRFNVAFGAAPLNAT